MSKTVSRGLFCEDFLEDTFLETLSCEDYRPQTAEDLKRPVGKLQFGKQ